MARNAKRASILFAEALVAEERKLPEATRFLRERALAYMAGGTTTNAEEPRAAP